MNYQIEIVDKVTGNVTKIVTDRYDVCTGLMWTNELIDLSKIKSVAIFIKLDQLSNINLNNVNYKLTQHPNFIVTNISNENGLLSITFTE